LIEQGKGYRNFIQSLIQRIPIAQIRGRGVLALAMSPCLTARFFSLSDCDSHTLTQPVFGDVYQPHQACVSSESCTEEQLETTANLPTLDDFVTFVSADRALADGKILNINTVPMSYDNLNGLYIGLLAGAIGNRVTLL
jgi:hypothetical protein